MNRILTALICAVALFSTPLTAQESPQPSDSKFDSYARYNAFVNKMITTRQWSDFVKRMGGRDEYTAEDLAKIVADFDRLYPNQFTAVTRFRETDLGGGIRQEARAFWGGGRYLFFYAVLHERKDALIVLNFAMNTKIERILSKF